MYSVAPVPGFLISRETCRRHGLHPGEFGADGRLVTRDFAGARRVARQLSVVGQPPVPASDVHALGLLDAAMRTLVCRHEMRHPGTIARAFEAACRTCGAAVVHGALREFVALFWPPVFLAESADPGRWLSGVDEEGIPRELAAFADLLLLRVVNGNPAVVRYREWFDDAPLVGAHAAVIGAVPAFFAAAADPAAGGESLFDVLCAPAVADPASLSGQLLNVLREREMLLDNGLAIEFLRGVDFLREEEIRDTGPGDSGGHAPVLDFGPVDGVEPECFSEDREWMPRLVLLAKNTRVWLDQMSRALGRPLRRLDEIPDAELALLAGRGITGLWLIGIWQRSRASENIKRMMGDAEAVASAYSLHGYDIAEDLGGWEALEELRRRAASHGLRLAADMVPNHMGIDSDWVNRHPDWFLSVPEPPYPGYTFEGPDLGSDDTVGIFLEDHYYTRSDAAVVFRRVDKGTGETRHIYHGNDGTSMPWNDTAQLNYLLPELREAVIGTILHVARHFPVIRFDAAMTLARKHIQRLWFPAPGGGGAIPSRVEHGMGADEFDRLLPGEFWREVVDRVAAEAPDTLLLAEAFWLMEGYFVRTLGMHRVYNSAFMHMLRDEDNAGYRLVMRNVLEFDPRVLQRFVNFMNNPDERTAVEQFGKGDKYFGICTLMVTLPGLPMFGHGQIEGFAEKYGMEYCRARRDEVPDEGFVRHHERAIFPLLHRRPLFAGVEGFFLYDFRDPAGHVNEDVFVFSNRRGDERALVFYQNKQATACGSVCLSTGYADAGGIARRTLAEGLALPDGALDFAVVRDAASGRERIFSCRGLAEHGLFLELGPYERRVFLDWRIVRGDDWREVHEIAGAGEVDSVEEIRARVRASRAVAGISESSLARAGNRRRMHAMTSNHDSGLPDYLREEILLHPERRRFPAFDLVRLLGTVFDPTAGCRVCILTDFDDPPVWIKDFAFLGADGFAVQKNAHKHFYLGLQGGAMEALGLRGGEMYAYRTTHGSNLDLADGVWDSTGKELSLDRDIYPNYDLILCISTFSATAPLTAKAKQFGFRGATLHGLNDVILGSGLAVDYHQVSADAERLRLAMTGADEVEIDFELEDGRILTAWLGLGAQEAQKSHGLCLGKTPDIANLPAGEVYFVPRDARGHFPMKYEDGTLGVLTVENRCIVKSELIAGKQATIDAHNARLADDPMTGTLGELGFGTQVLPVSGADIQDEKVLGTCHLATGRDDHLGGDIVPEMFKKHENSTHDDILFAPHKTPNFNIKQVRMKRGGQREVLIENFRPARYLMEALAQGR